MREEWYGPSVAKPEGKSVEPEARPSDDLEVLLAEYRRRKQQDAERLVRKALSIEQSRKRGAELLLQHAVRHAREVAGRLRQGGHRVVYQELLEVYPPSLRLHLYPHAGPMDLEDPDRWTFELTWGPVQPDRLVATRWTSTGLADQVEMGSIGADELDELWVREQFLAFVRHALDLS